MKEKEGNKKRSKYLRLLPSVISDKNLSEVERREEIRKIAKEAISKNRKALSILEPLDK